LFKTFKPNIGRFKVPGSKFNDIRKLKTFKPFNPLELFQTFQWFENIPIA